MYSITVIKLHYIFITSYHFISGKDIIYNSKNLHRIGQLFETGRGVVISKEFINENEGIYPVYSSQTTDNGILGYSNPKSLTRLWYNYMQYLIVTIEK